MSSGSLKPVLDYDLSDRSSMLLSDQHQVKLVSNLQPNGVELIGVGHEPVFNQNEWGFKEGSVQFTNTQNWLVFADQFLLTEEISSDIISGTFSIASSEWKPWTVFVVCQTLGSGSYSSIFNIAQDDQFTPWPKISIETSPTNYVVSVFNDGNHSGNINGTGGNVGTMDKNHHIIEVSANGSGNYNVWFDGTQVVTNGTDYRPKTCNKIALGSYWGFNPAGWLAPFTGLVAHVMIFDQNLTSSERVTVRTYLQTKHNI